MIQRNMSPDAIVDVWEFTIDIFKRYNIPIIKQTLEKLVEEEKLISLLTELNAAVGSSASTCIDGG